MTPVPDRQARILETLIEARLALRREWIAPIAVTRAGEGNPNHKPAGPGGGQFTSGGGGSGSHAEGKHHARRQRRKLRRLKERHRAERKEHLRREEGERKSLAREHAREHRRLDRQHEGRLKRHEATAPGRHAAVDREHAAKSERIAKGERKAKETEGRHAKERDEFEKTAGDHGHLHKANEKLYESQREALKKKGGTEQEHEALEKRIDEHKAKFADPHAGLRKGMEERHQKERQKSDAFLAKSGTLKERLSRQTAARHKHVDETPKRLEKKHAAEKREASARHEAERQEQHEEHRAERRKIGRRQRRERERVRGKGKAEEGPAPRDLAAADPKEVEQAHASMSQGWRKSLPEKDRAGVEQYTGRHYADVNAHLRKGTAISPEAKATMADMDRALATARLEESAVVYRGIDDIRKLGLSEKTLAGATVHDKGFLSTSLTPKAAAGFAQGKNAAVLRIVAPKGSPGASVAGITMVPREREVVFARGATIRIKSATRDPAGHFVVDAEMSHEARRSLAGADLVARSMEGRDDADRMATKFGWGEGDVEVVPGSGAARKGPRDISAARDRRFRPGRTHKAGSAESILRHCLRSLGSSAAYHRGELIGPEKLELLASVREYGRAWLHHEAQELFRVHGRTDEKTARTGLHPDAGPIPGTVGIAGNRAGHVGGSGECAPLVRSDGAGRTPHGGLRSEDETVGVHVRPEGQADPGDGGLTDGPRDKGCALGADPVASGNLGDRRLGDGAGECTETRRLGAAVDAEAVARALSVPLRSHLGRFFARAKQFARELILAGAMALNGPSPLDADDLAEADRQARAQAQYFDRFESEIALNPPRELAEPSGLALSSPMTAAEFAARVEMYAGSSWGGNLNAHRAKIIRSGKFNQERRLHWRPKAKDHPCETCEGESRKGWVPIGTLLPLGDSECLGIACDCFYEFRSVA